MVALFCFKPPHTLDIVGPIIAGLFALAFLLILIYALGAIFYGIIIAPIIFQFKLYKGVTAEQKMILLTKFPYYSSLNSKFKIEFERRLKYFLMNKEFEGRRMEITEEMRTLIGACAVQLTFGYRPLRLAHFPKILLYPGVFTTKDSNRKKKGEVNSRGIIVLSWEDFIKDYKIKDDGINLGLHEMAHALKIEDAFPDEEFNFLDEDELHHFHEVSSEEYKKIRRGEPSFLRSYAGSNREEFFAVAVEHFFEQPEKFEKALPEIYHSLVNLLKQNPGKKTVQTY
jgi:Mlc titration factor MtfA (ptsG expression regulator)